MRKGSSGFQTLCPGNMRSPLLWKASRLPNLVNSVKTLGVTSGTDDHSSNWQSAMGSGTAQNTYYFEGVETTSPDNAGSWLWANPDQIEEIDVIVSGAPAEYGNFQGMAG